MPQVSMQELAPGEKHQPKMAIVGMPCGPCESWALLGLLLPCSRETVLLPVVMASLLPAVVDCYGPLAVMSACTGSRQMLQAPVATQSWLVNIAAGQLDEP